MGYTLLNAVGTTHAVKEKCIEAEPQYLLQPPVRVCIAQENIAWESLKRRQHYAVELQYLFLRTPGSAWAIHVRALPHFFCFLSQVDQELVREIE